MREEGIELFTMAGAGIWRRTNPNTFTNVPEAVS